MSYLLKRPETYSQNIHQLELLQKDMEAQYARHQKSPLVHMDESKYKRGMNIIAKELEVNKQKLAESRQKRDEYRATRVNQQTVDYNTDSYEYFDPSVLPDEQLNPMVFTQQIKERLSQYQTEYRVLDWSKLQ